MKILILLTAFIATSALADFELKVNRIEASVIDESENSTREATDESKVKNETQVEKESVAVGTDGPDQREVAAVDWDGSYNSSRPNRSQGDEPGVLKGNLSADRLDDDSDDDGLDTDEVAKACGVDDDCNDDVDDATSDTARQARRQDRKTTRN